MAELVDTNVLVHAHDRDAGDKHALAVDLLARLARAGDLAISAQVLNELANVLLRKRKLDRVVVASAVAQVSARAIVLPLTGELTALALGPGMDAGLSFWDALVWATAHANGIGGAVQARSGAGRGLSVALRALDRAVRGPRLPLSRHGLLFQPVLERLQQRSAALAEDYRPVTGHELAPSR